MWTVGDGQDRIVTFALQRSGCHASDGRKASTHPFVLIVIAHVEHVIIALGASGARLSLGELIRPVNIGAASKDERYVLTYLVQ